jgi:hypothetical protein
MGYCPEMRPAVMHAHLGERCCHVVWLPCSLHLSWHSLGAAGTRWRLDQGVSSTTTQRQLAAMSRLGQLMDPGCKGEAAVRALLLGPPQAEALARRPTAWAQQDGWRADAAQHLQRMQALNPSQRRAVASALTRTFTLWQVRGLLCGDSAGGAVCKPAGVGEMLLADPACHLRCRVCLPPPGCRAPLAPARRAPCTPLLRCWFAPTQSFHCGAMRWAQSWRWQTPMQLQTTCCRGCCSEASKRCVLPWWQVAGCMVLPAVGW